MNLQKRSHWESENYIKWVCTQNCVVCGEPGHESNQIVPHHIKGIGHLSGAKLKAPDQWAMPMHAICHTQWHGDSKINQDLLEQQWEWVARTLAKAVEEGVLKVGGS